jgi:SAM-dependent methyltransferase
MSAPKPRGGGDTYEPREFWERRLSEQFDLRGTGATGLSLAYNEACYALRRHVLSRALREAGFDPAGQRVLDVGCGTGFFTAYYVSRGAVVTGLDIAPTSIERLRLRHPEAQFLLGDVSDAPIEERFDLVNAFDVLYHITDDQRWERAIHHLARAVSPNGLLLVTDTFAEMKAEAAHNRMRTLARYRGLLQPEGVEIVSLYPTHVLLNRELGLFRFMNHFPGVLHALDRALLGFGFGDDPRVSKLLVARRKH